FNTAFRKGSPISNKAIEYFKNGGKIVAFLPAEKTDEASAFGLSAKLLKDEQTKVSAQKLKDTYLDFMSEPGLKPESIRFYRSLLFSNAKPEDARLVTEAGPNVVTKEVGKGRVILAGYMPYQGYTDLMFNPNFVQMNLRTLWEAIGWEAMHSDNGTMPDWEKPGLSPDFSYILVDQEDDTRMLTVAGLGDKTKLIIPQDLKPNIYTINEEGEEIARFGHNMDVGDSDLDPVVPSMIEEAIDKHGLTYGTVADISERFVRSDLLWLTALLLLAALAFEAYAHFYRKT
ncbi:hypothetical protein BVX97_00850, partial [bacterium E08(2017)]